MSSNFLNNYCEKCVNLSKEKMHVDHRMFQLDDDVITITLQLFILQLLFILSRKI